MLQTKDLFGAVDAYVSYQHDIEAILRGDSLGGAGAAPSSGVAAKGGKSGGGEGSGSKEDSDEGGGGEGGGGKGGGGKGPSSPTTARRMAELKAHAPTTALAGRLAGCVCSLLRLQLAQLVLRVEALVVALAAKEVVAGALVDDEVAVRELLMTSDGL